MNLHKELRIAHFVSWYFPDSSGGCEVYVDELARCLFALGDVHSIVFCPESGSTVEEGFRCYEHNGVSVVRYPSTLTTHGRLRKEIEGRNISIVHLHSWRFGCGKAELRLFKKMGLPVVTTLHMPEFFCMRGTMMEFGERVCNGVLSLERCTACTSGVIPSSLWQKLSLVIPMPGRIVGWMQRNRFLRRIGEQWGAGLAYRRFHEGFRELVRNSSVLVALNEWSADVLRGNGVDESKIVMCRHGVLEAAKKNVDFIVRNSAEGKPVRMGFLGRWDRLKGLQMLVAAIRQLDAKVKIELLVHAMAANASDLKNKHELSEIIEGEPRIQLMDAVRRDEISDVINGFDVLAVPSQWMETGPLVVLEAQAAGIPVLGSNIGGIAEHVIDGVNGRLVQWDCVDAWTSAMESLALDRSQLARMQANCKPPRSMDAVASDMRDIYRGVC